jgi:hypothetical protein
MISIREEIKDNAAGAVAPDKQEYKKPQHHTNKTLMQEIFKIMEGMPDFERAKGILDYMIPSSFGEEKLTNYEFDVIATPNFGGSEGIYIDCYISGAYKEDNKDRMLKAGTLKTLGTSLEDMKIMGELCGIIEYAARDYIGKNLRLFQPNIEIGYDEVQRRQDEPERPEEQEATQIQGPNMAEVQSAEMKVSVVQGLDKSADGSTRIEGQDIGYEEEGYAAAANEVKYEAQRARTADGEQRIREAEKREESIPPKIGQRVMFHPHNTKTKLTGKVVDMDDETVTLQSGRVIIPAIRNEGVFTAVREPEQSHTKEYAREQAQKYVGDQGKVFLAKGSGANYKGVIVEKTPAFAIQKINAETAILHRLKDLEMKEKDGHGVPLQENEDFHLVQEGKEVSITREGPEKGGVTIKPWDREKEERQKVREHERSRGSQSR